MYLHWIRGEIVQNLTRQYLWIEIDNVQRSKCKTAAISASAIFNNCTLHQKIGLNN